MDRTRPPASRLTIKLPLLIIATALCVAVSAGAVASWSIYDASKRTIETHLSVLARDKRDAVATLVDSVRKDLVGAAGNPSVQRSLDRLAIGFKVLSDDERRGLRVKYADENAGQDAAKGYFDFYATDYKAIHGWFRTFARDRDYPDVLFLDRDGNVAYSLAKRDDYGANVRDATLAGTALGSLFARLAGQPSGTTLTTDFAPYAPAGHPAALSGTPVYQMLGTKSDFVGVLVFELPSARIDAVMNQPEGFGADGEVVVVGGDGLLRSNSRFGSHHDIGRTRFDDPGLVSPGPTGLVASTAGYRGDMIAAAFPMIDDSLHWSVIAAESTDELFRPVRRVILDVSATCLVVTVLLAFAAAAAARRMARPIVDLVERFDAALSNMTHGIAMTDVRGDFILCNAAFRDMYGLPTHLSVTGTPSTRILDHLASLGMQGVSSTEQEPAGNLTGCHELRDGRIIDVTRNIIPSGGFVATHRDVTATVRAQERIKHLASHDGLTGLPNRGHLRERMAVALERAQADERLAVLCLDLDHFKTVNDTLGHPVGDLLLKAVALRLGECLDDRDLLARLGGDEFVILQTGLPNAEGAGALARRLIEAIGTPFDLDGHHVVVGLSVGIAVTPDDGSDSDTLIRNADMALYRAKANGRGSSHFFEAAMNARLQERRRVELDLRQALAAGQFELHYQPLYDARTEAVTGAEALVRWRHPERGLVPPGEFIPIAEDMGLIIPLGEWVLRRACEDAARWSLPIRVAVNLSSLQFKTPALVPTIVSALARSGLPPTRLELEITETVLLGDNEATLATLHALRKLGIRIAMDDFGTGYSSLGYLRAFPFDKIKIDRSFVRDLATSANAVAIVKAISDLGLGLGMVTTAEGIETLEQLSLVRGQGCGEVQGFLMAKPQTAAAMSRLLDGDLERPRLSA